MVTLCACRVPGPSTLVGLEAPEKRVTIEGKESAAGPTRLTLLVPADALVTNESAFNDFSVALANVSSPRGEYRVQVEIVEPYVEGPAGTIGTLLETMKRLEPGADIVTVDRPGLRGAYALETSLGYELVGWFCGGGCIFIFRASFQGDIESNTDALLAMAESVRWISTSAD
jgi:hypothetical protein